MSSIERTTLYWWPSFVTAASNAFWLAVWRPVALLISMKSTLPGSTTTRSGAPARRPRAACFLRQAWVARDMHEEAAADAEVGDDRAVDGFFFHKPAFRLAASMASLCFRWLAHRNHFRQ